MKFLQNTDGRILRRIFRANMALGLTVTVVASYLMITGQYESLQARQAAETVLGYLAIGGLLYIVIFWYICTFSKPFFPARK